MLKFESLDACWREDIRRALALRRLPKSFYASIGECDPLQLASVLAEAAEARCIAKCAASAAYMRDRRLALLGSLLKLIDDEAQTDLTFVSISHVGWYFTARYNWRMPNMLSEHVCDLFQDRILHESGLFVGFINGRYVPEANNIQLSLTGICAGDKASAFRDRAENNDADFYYDLGFWDVKNLIRQISGVMPSEILEEPEGISDRIRRMRQPYHSAYLLWLVEHSLSALVMTSDVAVNEKGELINTPYPPETIALPSFLESTLPRDATGKVDWSGFIPADEWMATKS
jgi:hypothetical protein